LKYIRITLKNGDDRLFLSKNGVLLSIGINIKSSNVKKTQLYDFNDIKLIEIVNHVHEYDTIYIEKELWSDGE
jgi:hypothetical protein